MHSNRTFFIAVLLSTVTITCTFAQKLPNIQGVSVRAPANVKVDGKGTEWGAMKAYNKKTGIFYTIANDDKKLYFILQCKDQTYARKLVHGITLVVQPAGTKSTAGASMLKFPYLDDPNKWIFFTLNALSEKSIDGYAKDPDGKKADALLKQANEELRALSKKIYTKGIFDKDSILSIYNESGITATNSFTKDGISINTQDRIYASELAVDLRLLKLDAGKTGKFSYQILINAEPNKYSPKPVNIRSNLVRSAGQSDEEYEESLFKLQARFNASATAGSETTDFWGEYTLAK